MLPFKRPQRNRSPTAALNVGENPNKIAAIMVPARPFKRAILRPYLSAHTPHRIFPKMLPPLKAAPIKHKFYAQLEMLVLEFAENKVMHKYHWSVMH